MSGWIKLHRKLTEWEWYSDVNTSRVFIHLLLSANHKDKNWRGIEIKRGQKLTSLQKLADETNLSVKNIRTSLKHLKSTNEVASHSNAQHTVFTIINYDSYQGEASETAGEGQTCGKQVATNKNDNNKKNDNNNYINDAFDCFWLGMKLKKAAKPKALQSFTRLVKKESDPMSFAKMLVNDTVERFELNQFGFDRLNPTTYLNQKRWEDDKPEDINKEYSYLTEEFNSAVSGTNLQQSTGISQQHVDKLKHLYSTTSLSRDNIHKYFEYIANNDSFAWERGETGNEPMGLMYFLSEQAYNKARGR